MKEVMDLMDSVMINNVNYYESGTFNYKGRKCNLTIRSERIK